MRAAIYCRVSTAEQVNNLSLATQERACREFCEREGIQIAHVFVEEGESAKTAQRTKLQEMLAICERDRKRLDLVVVYKIDRLARNNTDHHAVRAILKRLDIGLRSVTEPINDSSTGRLMEGILASFAEFENSVRAERTEAGMKRALGEGRWTFQAPVGYL